MEAIGQHIFMFFYLISLFFGVIVLTLNGSSYKKEKNVQYKKLHIFYLAFFAHMLINFFYFYKAYFIALWEWKIIILCAVNVSIVIFVYFGLRGVADIVCHKNKPKHLIILITGAVYLITYVVLRAYYTGYTKTYADPVSEAFFIGSNGLFMVSGIFYCYKYCKADKDSGNPDKREPLVYILCSTISCYLIANFTVDVVFGMIQDRILLWGVNIYHSVVLLYLFMNIGLLMGVYVKANEKEAPLEEYSVHTLQTFEEISQAFHLTPREKEMLALVYEGYSSPAIAKMLNISGNTVKRHISNLYKKIGINSRIELIHRVKNK